MINNTSKNEQLSITNNTSDEDVDVEDEDEMVISSKVIEKRLNISENSSSSVSEIIDFVLMLPDNTKISIPVNTKTGYINVTKMCKAAGKEYSNWVKIKGANEIISSLERSLQIGRGSLIINITDGPRDQRGSFAHRRLAISIACWAHPSFGCQIAAWSEELLLTGKVTLGQETKIINNMDNTLINSSETTTFQLTLPSGSNMIIPIKNGRINATILCKAGGKEYSKWIRNKGSEEILLTLERSLQLSRDKIITTVTTGPNAQRGTFIHRRLGIIIAMWVSADFFTQVSSWIDELLITGSVVIGKEKSIEDLNKKFLEQVTKVELLENVVIARENTIMELSEEIKEKDRKVVNLTRHAEKIAKENTSLQKTNSDLSKSYDKMLMKRSYHKFKKGHCFYTVKDRWREKVYLKIGITKNINTRLAAYRTSMPDVEIILLVYINEHEFLETSIKIKFKDILIQLNHEYLVDIGDKKFIKMVKELIKYFNLDVTYEKNLNKYNEPYKVTEQQKIEIVIEEENNTEDEDDTDDEADDDKEDETGDDTKDEENDTEDEENDTDDDTEEEETRVVIKTFKCDHSECIKRKCFKKFGNYREHMKKYHNIVVGDDGKTCLVCKKPCRDRYERDAHMNTVHNKQKCICTLCDKSLSGPGGLRKHMKEVHERKIMYKCGKCSREFSSQGRLTYHRNQTHDNIAQECGVCHKFYKFLNSHMKTHTDRKILTCGICAKTYISIPCFQAHMSKIHKIC